MRCQMCTVKFTFGAIAKIRIRVESKKTIQNNF